MADKSKMKCNSPVSSDRPGKKKMVKACDNGQEKLIHFGADGYKHNYSAEAKKSFRARHGCDKANDKLSAKYWACKNLWPKNKNNFAEGGLVEDNSSCECENCKFKGGMVDGVELVEGDSETNDIVNVNLSPGELVIPKSVVEKGIDAINKFAKEHLDNPKMSKNNNLAEGGEPNPFADLGPEENPFADLGPQEEVATEKPSSAEIFLGGAIQGPTLGFADEIRAGLGSALEMLPGSSSNVDEELRKQGFQVPESANFKSLLKKERAEDKALQDASNGEYLAGNIFGGALTAPLLGLNAIKGASAGAKILNAATQAGRAGAITGLGTSEAKDLKGLIEDAGAGLGTGAVLGAGVQGTLGGAKALGSLVAEKNPSIPRAFQKGLEGVKSYSKEFADETGKKINSLVDDITGSIQTTKKNLQKVNDTNISKVQAQIDDIISDTKKDINLTKKLQTGINEGQKVKLELEKANLVKNIQQKFGETKNTISKAYDAIEQQIPEDFSFNIQDDLMSLENSLLKNGKSPEEAIAITQRFVGTQNPSQLSFNQLKDLRSIARDMSDSADPALMRSFSDVIKKLNANRATTLRSNAATADLADTLIANDKKYAGILDLQDSYFGKVNFDSKTNSVFTDPLLKENIANKETVRTVNDLLEGKAQKLSDVEELSKKLELIDPNLKQALEPQFDELITKNRNVKNFKPTEVDVNELLQNNPELSRLQKTLEQLKQKPEIKSQTDRLLNSDELQVRDYLKTALPELESPVLSDKGVSNIEKVLEDYKTLTGKDVKKEAIELVKDRSLARDASQEARGTLTPRSLGFIESLGQIPANVAGRAVRGVKEATSTVRNVSTDKISNIVDNLKKFNTPEASFQADRLREAAAKGPESRNAALFSAMQQSQSIRKLLKKEDEEGN